MGDFFLRRLLFLHVNSAYWYGVISGAYMTASLPMSCFCGVSLFIVNVIDLIEYEYCIEEKSILLARIYN